MQERMKRDEMQAKAARAEYGDLTAHQAFRYTKSNKTRATTSARGIARIYRQLKGLHEVCLSFTALNFLLIDVRQTRMMWRTETSEPAKLTCSIIQHPARILYYISS